MNRVAAGERFELLVFVGVVPKRASDKHIRGLWRCDCGEETEIAVSRVRHGYTKSCGCLANEISRATARTHGMRGTGEYSSWQAMKARCLDPNNKDYPRWGGKGVTVCWEWAESFEAFFAHVGRRPADTSLDRIDNTRGYEPGNVRWATREIQASNRSDSWSVEIDGAVYGSLREAAERFGVSETTIVRWCDGFVDQRRARQINGGYTPPRANCKRWRKYAV